MVECGAMRQPRIKVDGEGFYHVVSRIGGRRFLIDDAEKGILLSMIRAAAIFSGVELYTYAVMSNHFHLLVRVPKKQAVSDKELLRRMEALYGTPKFLKVLEKWEKWTAKKQEGRAEEEKARLRARMYDLSQFCKTFKETYTQDYNRRHDNTGTIWEGRFKSILLEGSWRTLMTVAGYIHLNPVRAEMVAKPEEAPNAGYGAACQGDTRAMTGLIGLVKRVYGVKETTWAQARGACAEVMAGALGGEVSDFKSQISDLNTRISDFRFQISSDAGRAAAKSFKTLLRRRVAGFLHGGALGGGRFLKRMAGCLPKRVRRRPASVLDGFGLQAAGGAREVS